jgi:hypothetical protein
MMFTEVMRTLLPALVLALTAAEGCASNPIPRPVSAASCGDQCASMNCPPGTHCTFTTSCTPRCEADPLPMRAP